MKYLWAIILTSLLTGCVTTSAVLTDSSVTYPPSKNIWLLSRAPEAEYIQIAVLEATGPVNTPLPDLLESMKKKGMELGADGVIPIQDVSTTQEQSLMYNPWLGGYQTIGGGTIPKIRGIAIKLVK